MTSIDWQLLHQYKHNLRQKYRVKFIGAIFDEKNRALVALDGSAKIQLDSADKIRLIS